MLPLALTACNFGDGPVASATAPANNLFTGPQAGTIANGAPALAGIPGATVAPDAIYDFAPTAQDPEGQRLEFSINNRPSWASFDPSTGRLVGTPRSTDVGVYPNIIIAASDGRASAAIGPFTIVVANGLAGPAGIGTAQLSWNAPDGVVGTNGQTSVTGYRIYWGASPDALVNTALVGGVDTTQYHVSGLGKGTWYFAVATTSTSGLESELSTIGSKTIG
jgi:hypothetical protein